MLSIMVKWSSHHDFAMATNNLIMSSMLNTMAIASCPGRTIITTGFTMGDNYVTKQPRTSSYMMLLE